MGGDLELADLAFRDKYPSEHNVLGHKGPYFFHFPLPGEVK